jgi:hypothetical protein
MLQVVLEGASYLHHCELLSTFVATLQLYSNDHVQKGTITYNYPPINFLKEK